MANDLSRRVGIIAFDGVNALDIAGPLEALQAAPSTAPGGAAYDIVIISPEGAPVRSAAGLAIGADVSFEAAPTCDTLIVPGGGELRRDEALRARIGDWIATRLAVTRRLVSVCTGFYALAASGALDGRRATTHWRHVADAARRFPEIRLEPNAIFVRDGPCASSAGVTAGIDLTLALIEEDLGPTAALAVARELVVFLKRPGGQMQFSEPLRFQTMARSRLADLAAWLPAHLENDLSVEALAARVNLSPRQFARVFKVTLGSTPAEFVARLRLDEAAGRLVSSALAIEAIARSVGFVSSDAFRRAFERRFGVAPSAYRERFTACGPPERTS